MLIWYGVLIYINHKFFSQRYILNDGSPFCIIWDTENLPKTSGTRVLPARPPAGNNQVLSREPRLVPQAATVFQVHSRWDVQVDVGAVGPKKYTIIKWDLFFFQMFGLVVFEEFKQGIMKWDPFLEGHQISCRCCWSF